MSLKMGTVIRAIEKLNLAMGVMTGGAILLITLIIVADVAMRSFLGAPIPGATESSTLLLIGLVYLGLASVQLSKANFRVEAVLSILPDKWSRWLEFTTTLIAMVAIGLFAWITGHEAWNSTMRGEMSYGAITFPVWPARVVITFGLILLTLQLLCDCLRLASGTTDTTDHQKERSVH
jgi:TRAP-type C4-dicarboxylate transport system permease small subunit